ncbi:MAG: sigma-70 family RNA polymerase sigma factor [Actinomycetales bacterium]|nr:sigma-70 family RNA polymerase sigma factor [Actinomycetales bacterium]
MLEQLVVERYPRLVSRARLVTGSVAEAEDLVQDALVATFSGRARLRSVEQAEAYVRRAIVTHSIDAGRRRAAEGRAMTRVAARPEPTAEVPGLTAEVEAALAGLPERERACVVLRHLEDRSVRETARLLRLSEGAVKRYTSDGVAALTAALGVAPPTSERTDVLEGRRTDA